MKIKNYNAEVQKAINHFWNSRMSQNKAGLEKDTGNRSSVTGGKQLDGFVNLLVEIAIEYGVPKSWIHVKAATLPGFFRPTKNWDLIIITDKGELLIVCELKSQVGSFGNNFNNRTEEVLGSAIDLWTAYREEGFGDQVAPWLGYMMVVEKSEKSSRPVRVNSPHFDARGEYEGMSYLDRYEQLCSKLVTERHYSSACVLATESNFSFEDMSEITSVQTFIRSFVGHLISRL